MSNWALHWAILSAQFLTHTNKVRSLCIPREKWDGEFNSLSLGQKYDRLLNNYVKWQAMGIGVDYLMGSVPILDKHWLIKATDSEQALLQTHSFLIGEVLKIANLCAYIWWKNDGKACMRLFSIYAYIWICAYYPDFTVCHIAHFVMMLILWLYMWTLKVLL